MRLLVCGGRYYSDETEAFATLDAYGATAAIVIQGGASGGDYLAKKWAIERGIHCAEVPAQWRLLGKSAGMRRNEAMLALQPDFFIAFPGGNGTADMVRRLRAAGVVGVEL